MTSVSTASPLAAIAPTISPSWTIGTPPPIAPVSGIIVTLKSPASSMSCSTLLAMLVRSPSTP